MAKRLPIETLVERGRERQNNRGWPELERYITKGDEFGFRISAAKLGRLFNRSRLTIEHWITRIRLERPDITLL